MKKLSLRWLAVCLLSITAAISVHAQNEAKSIYLLGGDNNWVEPIESNSSHYEQYRLFETAPGSNIFEGTFEHPYAYSSWWWFRFATALSPDGSTDAWDRNVIVPIGSEEDNTLKSKTGVYTASFKTYEYLANPPAFSIELPYNANDLRFTVNLNNSTMTIVANNAIFTLIDTKEVPTASTADKFTPISRKAFIEPGNRTISFYDLYRQTSLAPEQNTVISVEPHTYLRVTDGGKGLFELNDFKGGVFEVISANSPDVYCRFYTEFDTSVAAYEQAYLIGDFCEWSFDGAKEMTKSSDGQKFTATLPAGTREFKITSALDWNTNLGWSGAVKYTDGKICYTIATNGFNFQIKDGLSADAEVVLDFSTQTVSVTTDEAHMPEPNPSVSEPARPDFNDVLVISTPDDFVEVTADNFQYVYRNVDYLTRTAVNGVFSASISYSSGTYFRLVGPDQKVYAPTENTELPVTANGVSTLPASLLAQDQAAWWQTPLTVIEVPFEMSFDTNTKELTTHISAPDNGIYLVGVPTGWAEPSSSNKEFYSSWRLTPAGNGLYYGDFYIAEGEAMFRFYQGLYGWDVNSFGPAVNDEPIEFEWINDQSLYLTRGKASYSFPDWKGGQMQILLDMYHAEARFSTSGFDNVETPESAPLSLTAVAGGLRASCSEPTLLTVYSLTGVAVVNTELQPGITTIDLPAGFYIAAGKKYIVK